MIYIGESFEFDSPITIDGGREVTIQSSDETDHIFTQPTDRHFVVNSGSSLTLGSGIILDGNETGGGIHVSVGQFTMNDGAIRNCRADEGGGGVRSGLNCKIMIEAGLIYDNKAGEYGGGIFSNGEFIMQGGDIQENAARAGGGINVTQNSFHMQGENIQGNKAAISGGGILVFGRLTMEGGSIQENTAIGENGGGVSEWQGGTFTIIEGTISKNDARENGGGISVQSGGTLIMKDGDIYDNLSEHDGGGVHTWSNGLYDAQGGSIQGNTAQNRGGVFINNLRTDNLITEENVVFSGNSADTLYRPPYGVESAFPNIKTRSSSQYNHPLNNYDIGYQEIESPNNIHTLSLSRSPEVVGDIKVEDEMNLTSVEFMFGGLEVNLVADPAPGYKFIGWTSSNGGTFADHMNSSTVFTTPAHDTEITANFQKMILDPLDPDKEVNPENPPIIEGDGFLCIDFVSSFNFGEQRISVTQVDYYAAPQRLLGENGLLLEDEERPNYIQISDNRLDKNGWTLSVTQLEQFHNTDGHVLKEAKLTLQHAEAVPLVAGTPPSRIEPTVTLNIGMSHVLMQAKPGEGEGTWIYRFGDQEHFREGVKLDVPQRGLTLETQLIRPPLIGH